LLQPERGFAAAASKQRARPESQRAQGRHERVQRAAHVAEAGLGGFEGGLVHVEVAAQLDLDGVDAIGGAAVVGGDEAALVRIVGGDAKAGVFEVARHVRMLLERSGLAQQEFASRIGVPNDQFTEYLTAETSPSAALMVRMRRLSDRFAKMRSERSD